jgi:hypothetical protein
MSLIRPLLLPVGRGPTGGNKRVTFIMQRAARTAAILQA